MTSVLAVDGNSLAHRAFHALASERLDGPWMTHGVVRMLATAWDHGPFDGIVVAFDSPNNRRKEQYPGYKAHRDDTDPELKRQLRDLPDHLTACGFHVAEADGAEADDLLAAGADACVARGWRCTVLSSDRDLLALVSDDVTLLRPRGTMADLGVYDPDAVIAEYGIRPEQYTDLAALRGDPSDGLDGVHGVGPKTAARLLRDYGDVPGIYAQLCNLSPKLEATLRAGRENVERNLWLMAPIPRLEVDVEAAVAAGVDAGRVETALAELGLRSAAGRFRAALERPPLPPLPPPPMHPPDEPVGEAADPRRPAPPVTDRRAPARHDSVPVASGEQASLF